MLCDCRRDPALTTAALGPTLACRGRRHSILDHMRQGRQTETDSGKQGHTETERHTEKKTRGTNHTKTQHLQQQRRPGGITKANRIIKGGTARD